MTFTDRKQAGQQLAAALEPWRSERPVVLGLPRGGVPVAYEVAQRLAAPLDIIAVRKLGAPGYPEYALGAIAEGGAVFINPEALRNLPSARGELEEIAQREGEELRRRVELYGGGRERPTLKGRTVLLVDDGIATGSTMRAAIRAVRAQGAKTLVVASPVTAADTADAMRAEADAVVSLLEPQDFMAVGDWYESFPQVSDGEVLALLRRQPADSEPATSRGTARAPLRAEIRIPLERGSVAGTLALPAGARGLVLFAHGSGSSRFSPRNRYVASELEKAGLGTLLMDLLTADEEAGEEAGGELRFDIPLLAERVALALRWLQQDPRTAHLPLGLFGASTGAAAALEAAAREPARVRAVVSRGGRPDLASAEALEKVRAPTLLIVGGDDTEVLALNREALAAMRAPGQLAEVPGATHLFEEPGTLETVAELAVRWFTLHLAEAPQAFAR